MEKRIRAIEPSWNGAYPEVSGGVSNFSAQGASNFAGDDTLSDHEVEVPVNVVDHAVDQVGDPTRAHQHYAIELMSEIPPAVLENAHEPYGARAVLYALLFDRRDPTIRRVQLQTLEKLARPDVVQATKALFAIDRRVGRSRTASDRGLSTARTQVDVRNPVS